MTQPPPPQDPELSTLDARIHSLDHATRAFKRRLSTYHFFIMGKPRPVAPRPHIILICDTGNFVGEDRLLGGRYKIPRADALTVRAEALISVLGRELGEVTGVMDVLGAALKDTLRRRSRDRKAVEELEVLGEWMGRVVKRVGLLQGEVDRVVAMERDGWEVGFVIVAVCEWEFKMRAREWRRRLY